MAEAATPPVIDMLTYFLFAPSPKIDVSYVHYVNDFLQKNYEKIASCYRTFLKTSNPVKRLSIFNGPLHFVCSTTTAGSQLKTELIDEKSKVSFEFYFSKPR